MAPHFRPPSASECSSHTVPSNDASSSEARVDSPRPSHQLFSPDSITSVDSVDSVPVLGAYPLGSLHIHAPQDDEQDMMDHDNGTAAAAAPPPASERVQQLLRAGDVVILADLPVGFTVGCDAISFTSTERFLGFRDVPPGAHLVWVAPSESTSSRSAFWFHTPEKSGPGPGKVYVKQWDKFNELLGDPASQAEARFQRERLDEGLGQLVPYHFKGSPHAASGRPDPSARGDDEAASPPPLEGSTMWYQLTHAIHPGLLDRITGGPKETWPVHTSDQVTGETTLAAEGRLYNTNPLATPLRFTFPADQKLFDAAAEGAERTSQALDPTAWVLAQLGRAGADESDLVGELQFLFLTGMHLGNYSCLAQWWHYTTRVVFRSYRLAAARPALARALVQAVHAQLVHDDARLAGSVRDTAPGRARALQRALTVYRSRLRELLPPNTAAAATPGDGAASSSSSSSAQQAVGAAFDALAAWLAVRWDWDLAADYVRSGPVMLEDGEMVQVDVSDFEDEDERGEFAAVVVDIDDDGRPRDFISV